VNTVSATTTQALSTRTFGIGLARAAALFVLASQTTGVALAQGGGSGAPTIEPPSCIVSVDPGEAKSFQAVVKVPGIPVAPKADIYILADTTGSMTPVLDALKQNVGALATSLFSIPGADLRIGVGAYRDFPLQPQNQYAFEHRQSMTSDLGLIQNAVDSWVAQFGGDQAEAGFYALETLATEPAANFGWRDNTQRIIVWFGDAPSHDPVCKQLTGLSNDITEASVIAALAGAGVGGTRVIAISAPTNLPMGLNDNPTGANATGYSSLCPSILGSVGQASRIASATGGISTMITMAGDIAQAIEDTLTTVLLETTVELKAEGEIVPYITGISPGATTIVLPDDPNDFVEITFTIDVLGGACVENSQSYQGGLRVCLGGVSTDTVKQVTIEQSQCFTVCLWALGFETVDLEVGNDLPGASDRAYVMPSYVYPVLMDSIPALWIPDDPALVGVDIYSQIVMYNPHDFPGDPLKVSNAICYTLGGGTKKFGQGSGIHQFATSAPAIGTNLGMGFYIE
jgi:hypothetical protein